MPWWEFFRAPHGVKYDGCVAIESFDPNLANIARLCCIWRKLCVHQAHSSLMRPEKELEGLQKILPKPGEIQTVSNPLTADAFAFYDDTQHAWVAEKDRFTIQVGGSSRQLKLAAEYQLAARTVLK